jgi:acetyltransferase-like isoleucine patch superfamily enzyme
MISEFVGLLVISFRKLGFKVVKFFVPELVGFNTTYSERKITYELGCLSDISDRLGFIAPDVTLYYPMIVTKPENVFLHENTHIWNGSTILIHSARFIMKKNSGAAQGLMVITGNHTSRVGVLFKDLINVQDVEKDVTVEEDVWIGANVTLLAGVVVGRGSIVGAGTVCRRSNPPYSIVVGNPAKIVGFRFTPDEIIAHEEVLYDYSERISKDILLKNYNKYFVDSLSNITDFIKPSF